MCIALSGLDSNANINENDSYCNLYRDNSMYVCVCNAITEREIRQAIELGANTILELKRSLGVAANCGKCVDCARDILCDENANASSAGAGFALVQAA